MHVRSYYDGETELDLLMKVVDTLREELVSVKENQRTLNENVAKVIGFVKRIELHIGNELNSNDEEQGDSQDEDSVSLSNEER